MNKTRYSFFFHGSKSNRGVIALRRLFILLLMLLPLLAWAQAAPAQDRLRQGLQFFKQEDFQQAIQSFRALVFDPAAGPAKADAYYWIARSYLAIGMLNEAERNLEYFLENFLSHAYRPDALYQKGRMLYLQGDPESSIRVLESFISEYPSSEFLGSAYYWLGECLFSLGHLEEAARVFNKVVEQFPKSVKFEASRYRMSLIELKKREDELLKLLKWSHEEALKSVEEFQRREKAYEQAINVYQRKLSALTQGEGTEDAGLNKLQQENTALKGRIEVLEAQLSTQTGQSTKQSAAVAARLPAFENREKALRVKEEALAVKEALLRALAESTGQNP